MLLLEAGAAEHRPALCWPEGHRRLCAALRTDSVGLGAYPFAAARLLGLALLAALGVVRKLFLMEEQLFACGKHKLGTAVTALQFPICKFHGRFP